jgi:hypothetical protein
LSTVGDPDVDAGGSKLLAYLILTIPDPPAPEVAKL